MSLLNVLVEVESDDFSELEHEANHWLRRLGLSMGRFGEPPDGYTVKYEATTDHGRWRMRCSVRRSYPAPDQIEDLNSGKMRALGV